MGLPFARARRSLITCGRGLRAVAAQSTLRISTGSLSDPVSICNMVTPRYGYSLGYFSPRLRSVTSATDTSVADKPNYRWLRRRASA
jgi:hypothetical protein